MIPTPQTPLPPVDGRRLSSFTYDVIKERLLEGAWRAGDYIGVDSLKAELGVSKQPVMDALRRLSVDGLIEIIPQVGCRVPTYTLEETTDFFEIFASLEAEATAVAARRRTEDQISELVALNAGIAELRVIENPTERVHGYLVLNRRFHRVIQRMAHSSVVLRLSDRMWDMCDLLMNTSTGTRPLADEIEERHADHERIIAALRGPDVSAAREEMRGHIVRNIPMLARQRTE